MRKVEFSTTTVLQSDFWGNPCLVIIVPKEQESSFDSRGGDIINVTVEPKERE